MGPVRQPPFELTRSGGDEDYGGEDGGDAQPLGAGKAFVENEPGEEDGRGRVEGGQDGGDVQAPKGAGKGEEGVAGRFQKSGKRQQRQTQGWLGRGGPPA